MKKQKYKIVLPKFDKWVDLFELLSDKYDWGLTQQDILDDFAETIKHEYPHGVRIGDKYIQK